MGVEPECATGSLRVSMGWSTAEADLDGFIRLLPRLIENLRAVKVAA
jgi:cysteine sulfinate desulfinase/cysteine desulfurase-like protein